MDTWPKIANLGFCSEIQNRDWETLVIWGIYNVPEAKDWMYSIEQEMGCSSYKACIFASSYVQPYADKHSRGITMIFTSSQASCTCALLVLWDRHTQYLSNDCILKIKLVWSGFLLLITKRVCVCVSLCVKSFWLFICILKKSLPLCQKGVSFLRIWALFVSSIFLSPGLNTGGCYGHSTEYALC